ncbi:hypothetical protein C4569_02495 [Candidatus Parcubacteria bacterium]|nr:MAG: hypothetical protein C4569_02495 [Candidatus Parcubacteria bacterium]
MFPKKKDLFFVFAALLAVTVIGCGGGGGGGGAVNQPPVIYPPVPNITTVQDQSVTLDLTGYETDPDDPHEKLTWSVSDVDETIFTASVEKSTDILCIIPKPGATGCDDIKLTLTDSQGACDWQLVTVTILAAGSNPPQISDIPDVHLHPGQTGDLNLDSYVSDPDNADSELTWQAAGQSRISVSIDPVSRLATFVAPADFLGTEEITFTVFDPQGLFDSDTMSVIVSEVVSGDLNGKLMTLIWVNYCPSGQWDPSEGVFPSETVIREDLQLLNSVGFTGIITCSAANVLGKIPQFAKECGFSGVIMGIDDPLSEEEKSNAYDAAVFVDGYSVGNNGLTFAVFYGDPYTYEQLLLAISDLKAATGKPVSTSEPINTYFDGSFFVSAEQIMAAGDWLFPNIYPYFEDIGNPGQASLETDNAFRQLWYSKEYFGVGDKNIFIRETGLPSSGCAECSEMNQAEYFEELEMTATKFAYFEGFDQPWREAEIERHLGLYYNDRSEKLAAGNLSLPGINLLDVPILGSQDNLKGRVLNVVPSDFRIISYIKVDSSWYIRPSSLSPFTVIESDGRFEVDITTQPGDENADEIALFVVSPAYVPPPSSLPLAGDYLTAEKVLR